MYVKIDDTYYDVIDQKGSEVCIIQTFDFEDGTKRQLRIWTDNYTIVKDNFSYKG